MDEVLKFISDEMKNLNVRYEFMEWTGKVKYPYFVGEFSETDPVTEDGLEEKTIIITGFHRGKWLDLIEIQEKIKKNFPSVGGRTAVLESGSGIAVFYGNGFPVPTGELDLKKIQINLNIKLWKVG